MADHRCPQAAALAECQAECQAETSTKPTTLSFLLPFFLLQPKYRSGHSTFPVREDYLPHLPEPVILVASAEFTLKSSPVRRTLEQRLIDDLRFKLSRAGFAGFRVEKDAGRLVVRGVRESLSGARSCSQIFGVAYAAPALLLPASMESVLQTVVNLARERLRSGQSFAIRAHRSAPSSLSRRGIEVKGGSEVLHVLKDSGIRVDLGHPDVTFHVDLAWERAYVYSEKFQGPGGLPLSSQWKMLAVLDSGPLTLLAAYAMMRRGCLVELFIPISTIIATFASENQLDLARNLRQLVTRQSYRAFTFDFDKLEREVGDKPQLAASKCLVRLAAAKFAKEKRFKGMVFADIAGNIGLPQPLGTAATELPVFTPLIGLDMEELIEMSKMAGVPVDELFSQAELQIDSAPPILSRQIDLVPVEQLSL